MRFFLFFDRNIYRKHKYRCRHFSITSTVQYQKIRENRRPTRERNSFNAGRQTGILNSSETILSDRIAIFLSPASLCKSGIPNTSVSDADENCSLYVSRQPFYHSKQSPLVFPMRSDWTYATKFSTAMQRLKETGELQLLYKK